MPGLNSRQTEAVTYGDGPLLVLAGAGSGKTRVITHRIAELIRRGVAPDDILAVTFTNKAANEMRERVIPLVGGARVAERIRIGTFHSFGLHLLKAEHTHLGVPRTFAIYDAADQHGLVRELLRGIATGGRRYDTSALLARISLAKNAFVGPDEFSVRDGDDYDDVTRDLYPRYERALRSFAAFDFDDLICAPVRLLTQDRLAHSRWSQRYRHVLVDEYQDTNRAQLLLLKQLAGQGNICVVGDDDQSIYAWRGADSGNILQFEREFPGAKTVVLDQNYRSTPQILAAANAVISRNVARHAKVLWSSQQNGPKVASVLVERADNEAAFVCDELARLQREGVLRFSDVAVLYRSNIQTRELEEVLRERGVPYVLIGGQQFFERKEVKDILAYLRAALSSRDEISLRRIINYPARGIGAQTVEHIGEWARQHRCTMWTALGRVHEIESLTASARRAVGEFVALMRQLGDNLSLGAHAAAVQLVSAIDLAGDIRAASPSAAAAQRRLDNVDSLLRTLQRHDERAQGRAALGEFLRKLALDAKDDDPAPEAGERVTLVTLHGAKGLEFPVVFLIGFEEELLPHARSLMPHATDVNDIDHVADVAEERRLAYVGMTRAQQRLYLVRCRVRRRHNKDRECAPSRFLADIPAELIEERDVIAEGAVPVAAGELSNFLQAFRDW